MKKNLYILRLLITILSLALASCDQAASTAPATESSTPTQNVSVPLTLTTAPTAVIEPTSTSIIASVTPIVIRVTSVIVYCGDVALKDAPQLVNSRRWNCVGNRWVDSDADMRQETSTLIVYRAEDELTVGWTTDDPTNLGDKLIYSTNYTYENMLQAVEKACEYENFTGGVKNDLAVYINGVYFYDLCT